ncbi:MAG: alpha/beta fold hydrolase [Candidatus Tumulicola sp.]
MSALVLPERKPAQSYGDGLERARAIMALDGADVLPAAHSALLEHGRRTPLAVVLLHGYTNNPAQYAAFAPQLFQRGVNVFVPRMPEHGDRDRLTARIAGLTAGALVRGVAEALDAASGLGERVGVLGISMGGSLAAYVAQHWEVAVAVPVAPDFALLELPYSVSRFAGRVLSVLPNLFMWWDPRERARHQPLTAYPRFSTRALAQTLLIGDDVHAAARLEPPRAVRIVTIVNRCDPAVNNEVTQQISLEWTGWRPRGVEYVELRGLPENHDIVDPQNPLARTDRVYPMLLKALGADGQKP